MRQKEIIWLRDQEYQILAAEHPSSEPLSGAANVENSTEASLENPTGSVSSADALPGTSAGRDSTADALPEVSAAEASRNGRYIIQDRKLKWEIRQADGSCRYEDCAYSGGLVAARDLNAIPLSEGAPACYQYNLVVELIFENGDVTALIDHSRAMKKVAKNLDYQLRSLKKRRDVYVIRRFLKKTFVRRYPVKWVKRG